MIPAMPRILLIEDEPDLARAVARGLAEEGYVVDVEHDGQEGLFAALEGDYDLLLLDRLLPRFSGDDLCRRLRLDGLAVPVLMLTALDGTRDVVAGLDAGADDYLAKPFAFEELLARIRALLRRAAGQAGPRLVAGALELDPRHRRAWWRGRPAPLTATELGILEDLVRHRGQVRSRGQIAAAVRDLPEALSSNAVEVHISHIRRKTAPHVVETVRGLGYRVEAPE